MVGVGSNSTFAVVRNHISILIEQDTVILFAESLFASNYLAAFCAAMRLGDVEFGHGSKELGTYKPYACVILDAKKLAPEK